jgi:hypothetical protein
MVLATPLFLTVPFTYRLNPVRVCCFMIPPD